jgi:hypothetical protein
VPAGLAQVDVAAGRVDRVVPVERPDPRTPVSSAVLGDALLEQRGPDLVALRPSP